MTPTHGRRGIYYWKCDRAAAFHGTAQGAARARPEVETAVRSLVARVAGVAPVALRDGGGQGNHLTFLAELPDRAPLFVRIEDGPEQDDYLAVESHVMALVRTLGVPTPRVHATDAGRSEVPFAWQILEYVPHPDLNRHFKAGTLDVSAVATQIGRLIAMWQQVPVEGFGPFDVSPVLGGEGLRGLHARYADYFLTRLEAHLEFLEARKFLPPTQAGEVRVELERARPLLALERGCLVHKDTALWNLLGTEWEVKAVIDWDDCIAGDPMDDLALLGCFHDGAFLRAAFSGYASVRSLPEESGRRFWLHVLRNMIFKAVIRVGAGYFDHDSRFFLIGAGGSGASLREQTQARIAAALDGLREGRDPFSL
jgi:aminoglycoside phosphotransferase (APT) family kinase protein